jgi:glycosyltransferase involved in cell wall biosynthesis
MKPQLSIVMPVYNEEAVIADVVEELKRDVCDRLEHAEIVIVNDASTDSTAQILDRLADDDSRVRVHHAEQNGGHGRALRRALDSSTGEWVFQIDSDGQQVPAEFWRLWERRSGADLVMGVRTTLRAGRHRVLVSAGARWINRLIGGGDIRDVNVPFKLISRRLWDSVSPEIPRQSVAPSLLLSVGAGLGGWRIEQVPITHLPRRHGPSSVDLRALVRLSRLALSDVVRFRMRAGRQPRRPGPDATGGPAVAASRREPRRR